MCELHRPRDRSRRPEAHFTTGLFSLVEAFADIRMAEAVAELGLAADVQAALLQRQGPMGEVLTEVEAFDSSRLTLLSVPAKLLRDAYMQSALVGRRDHTFSPSPAASEKPEVNKRRLAPLFTHYGG